MLDPRTLQALQNYLGTALSGMLTPEQLATVNTLVQNAPQDPAIQATTMGTVNPGTSAGPVPGNPPSLSSFGPPPPPAPMPTFDTPPTGEPPTGAPPTGDRVPATMPNAAPATGGGSGGGVGGSIGFNGQGLLTTTQPAAAAPGGAPVDASGHVTGSGPGYAGANTGNNKFLPNGQIQLAADDPDADRLIAAHPGMYVKQPSPAGATPKPAVTNTGGTVNAGGGVTLSGGQKTWMQQQIDAANKANVTNKGTTDKGTTAMARGGVIREPIAGIGEQSGRHYELGEAGPETVTPGAPAPQSGQMPGAAPMMPTAGTMAPQPQMQPGMQPGMPQPGMAPKPAGPPVGMAQASWAKTKPGVLNFIKGAANGSPPPAAGATGKPPPKGDPNRRDVPI